MTLPIAHPPSFMPFEWLLIAEADQSLFTDRVNAAAREGFSLLSDRYFRTTALATRDYSAVVHSVLMAREQRIPNS